MTWAIQGVIEGFYGRPWSWDERIEVAAWCAARGMTHYVYAPKDDPKHRQRWRAPYDPEELAGFARMVDDGSVVVGFGVSPGLSIDHRSDDDLAALGDKVDQVVDVGVGLVVLLLDDLPVRPDDSAGLGAEHAAITRSLLDHLGDRAELVLVPTEYTGVIATPYLDALVAGVPEAVPIAWTGPSVVNDSISAADAERRAAALGGRPPLLWDNYPANDALMADRLFLGPLSGRDPGLAEVRRLPGQPDGAAPLLEAAAGVRRRLPAG